MWQEKEAAKTHLGFTSINKQVSKQGNRGSNPTVRQKGQAGQQDRANKPRNNITGNNINKNPQSHELIRIGIYQ
jgi:hypothetical protein